jgi:hypothetical protein
MMGQGGGSAHGSKRDGVLFRIHESLLDVASVNIRIALYVDTVNTFP